METLSLTYDELAQRLGITRKSAQNLARKKTWKRSTGNDKRVRVQVPRDALPDTPPKAPSNGPPEGVLDGPLEVKTPHKIATEAAVLRGKLEGTEAVIGFLKEQVEDLKQERESWKSEAEDWKQLAQEQSQTTQRLLEDKLPTRSLSEVISRLFKRPKLDQI